MNNYYVALAYGCGAYGTESAYSQCATQSSTDSTVTPTPNTTSGPKTTTVQPMARDVAGSGRAKAGIAFSISIASLILFLFFFFLLAKRRHRKDQ